MEQGGGAPPTGASDSQTSADTETPDSSAHLGSKSASASGQLSGQYASSNIDSVHHGGYDRGQHIVRVEYVSDVDARRSLLALKLSGYVAIAVTVVLLALKASPDAGALIVLNRGFHVGNLAVAAALLCFLLPYHVHHAWRIAVCVRSPKTWTSGRWHTATAGSLRGAAMVVILGLFLASNAAVLARPSMWCSSDAVVWIVCVTLSLWNCLFASQTYYSSCLVLIPRPGSSKRTDLTVADMPWTYHWPLLLLVAAVQGIIVWTLVSATSDAVIDITFVDPSNQTCTWGARLHCEPHTIVVVLTSLTVGGFTVYWLCSVFFLAKAWRQVHQRPYALYRVTHAKIRLQIQYLVGFTIAIGSSVLLWVAGGNACVNYALAWFGVMPLTIGMTGLVWLNLYLSKPRHPDAPPPELNEIFQRFAWTEGSKPAQVERRNQQLLDPQAHAEPMFCMESAIKLFYWSALVYDYTEAEGHVFSSLPEVIRELLGEVEQAMTFYKLTSRRLFFDRDLETKILTAWSDRTILISIRGSQATANFVQDIQVLQATHPPKRRNQGHVPRVHVGFLRTWRAGGIDELLVQHVRQLLDSAEDRDDVQLLLTGHSLGGAVATLAAYDIVKKCGLRRDQVSVYTFGCPRVGNHAFARDYAETVPDTWSIINDQDVVTRGLKLYGLYKRAGHRVIINSAGDLIVRPSLFELTLMQLPFSASATHHHTTSYQTALYSVLRSQMDKGKRHREGLAGVLELLKAAPIVHEALHQMAVKVGHSSLAEQLRSISLVSIDPVSESFRVGGVACPAAARGRAALEEALAAVPVRTDVLGREEHEPVYVEAGGGAGGIDAPEDETASVSAAAKAEGAPCGVADAAAGAAAAAAAPQPDDVVAVDMPAADRPSTGAAPASLWRRAAERVRLAGRALVQLGEGGGLRDGGGASPSSDALKARPCYVIPEHDGRLREEPGSDAAAALQGGAAGWRCPLRAPISELPGNAQVHADGAIISIGSSPDMKASRPLGRRSAAASAACTVLPLHEHSAFDRPS